MDGLDLLVNDHRRAEQLFRNYHAAASGRQRRAVVDLMIRELSRHAALEEMLVYPLAKEALPDGEQEVERHLADHMALKKTLFALDRLPAGDERTGDLVAELRAEVEDHVREEEEEFMPRLRAAVSQGELDRLGRHLVKAERSAPTRPHPNAPEQPPALTLAGPLAAAYDRFRDRIQRRPMT
ncbi:MULTISPECIES: hemerythrin domain-containing protein [unclassified Streptomyces]|uniref:hemerythrin domain-containing protein n=1 Tax=unclassified Streptomyces TaxID=2593676 RepID=UPI001F035F05|nr:MULTISPECIES: hemerythrin domain-containing protein [unclassified Streptomyces]MCH0566719.1 hemerythrin domain-containing protein [Streptomyces sp. MUM 2J]MCH0572187.1 hemerythrin domain-containing protein [Streptomyces sp. MUM 136J]